MPYATDTILAEHVAAEAARQVWEQGAKVMVLPSVAFGVNTGQLDIPFTINMNPSTQALVLRDVAHALSGQGIKKLVILNAHGGNDFRQMIRELQASQPDMFISTINWWKTADGAAYFAEPGDHAGELETSAIMHLTPDWVLPLSEAGAGKSNLFKIKALREGWAWTPRAWTKATNDTGVGNPALSTAAKGAEFLAATAGAIAGYLAELAAADINDLYEKPDSN
ncbi:MAG: Creatinine amidohydrolase [uncultured Adhaeribacter sp.]|uniref:Creatinine amidohydrolase n=1 Tax=uncultured Adhaeribacter sp. TaxID=448109 RepID=A0A6J4J966_9BACT|nr:MAG: Creatinine amidohydrolase [uncultured Adhaeribacter sp.]